MSVSEPVYIGVLAVVVVTVMHVLLFVLRECEGDGNASVVSGGGVVAYMGGTRGAARGCDTCMARGRSGLFVLMAGPGICILC